MAQKKIGQILKEMELVMEGDIQEALSIQRTKGGLFGKILVELGSITDGDLMFALAKQNDMEFIDLDKREVPIELLDFVTDSQAASYRVVPVSFDGKKRTLTLALEDPSNIAVFDELSFALADKVPGGLRIVGALATKDAIDRALNKYYGIGDVKSIADNLSGGAVDMSVVQQGFEGYDRVAVDSDANAPAVVKLLNFLLATAIRDHAADIHLEPFENEFRVRYRVDGALLQMESPPRELAAPLISRVKVISKLDIAETRLPQDGRIELTIGGRKVDLRVSTLPTMFGESCVMRILDRSNVSLDLNNLGLRQADKELIQALIGKPNGIVLVTGPTGSGKTTTLYSCLNEINTIDLKIITTEDPVEYDLAGIMQCQVNEEVGLSYAAALRSILRQDPDVILVGEIRDKETATIAVEASLTGHLVLSTLHTNDAPSTVTRMIDIGIEDFLVAATLEAIIAQRLVRKIDPNCKEFYAPEPEHLLELALKPEQVGTKKFAFGKGCQKCNQTGYKGREALFEFMIINESIKQLILDGASSGALRNQARATGMRTLRESGILSILEARTTIEEVMRETLSLEL
jgi:type IV pilus assembly protein PilB